MKLSPYRFRFRCLYAPMPEIPMAHILDGNRTQTIRCAHVKRKSTNNETRQPIRFGVQYFPPEFHPCHTKNVSACGGDERKKKRFLLTRSIETKKDPSQSIFNQSRCRCSTKKEKQPLSRVKFRLNSLHILLLGKNLAKDIF